MSENKESRPVTKYPSKPVFQFTDPFLYGASVGLILQLVVRRVQGEHMSASKDLAKYRATQLSQGNVVRGLRHVVLRLL